MTTITIDRATVEQALEALELVTDLTNHDDEIYGAIDALRAALAQQAEPVADPFSCPKCGRHDYGLHGACPTCDMFKGGVIWHWPDQMPDGTKLHAAPPQQAEPVEPVAWVGDPSTQDYASTVPDPQIEDRLARHGIPMPGDPK